MKFIWTLSEFCLTTAHFGDTNPGKSDRCFISNSEFGIHSEFRNSGIRNSGIPSEFGILPIIKILKAHGLFKNGIKEECRTLSVF